MEKLRPSKAYLVMSTSISVIHELAVFDSCNCPCHAAFNQVVWKNTCFYPKLFAEKFAVSLSQKLSKTTRSRGYVAFDPHEPVTHRILRYNPHKYEQFPSAAVVL